MPRSAITEPPRSRRFGCPAARQALALQVGGQRVVLLQVAEARLRARRAGAAAPPGARSPGRCRSSAAVSSAPSRPARRRLAAARAVAARHRHRAARDRRRARPRLAPRARPSGAPPRGRAAAARPDRPAPIASTTSLERLEAVAAHERVAVRQRRHHAAGARREAARADPRVDPHDPVREPRAAAPSRGRRAPGRRAPSRRTGSR